MKLKSLLLATTLCLGSSAFLSAKTRVFTIDKPVMIGNYNVPPGTYRMRVKGNTAEITDLNHYAEKKPVSVTITRENNDQRPKYTVVRTVNDGDAYRVTAIDLSRSTSTVTFQ